MKTRHLLALALPLITCTAPHTAPRTLYRDFSEDVGMVDDSIIAMRFNPPPIYLIWMAEVIRCSGIVPDSMPKYWLASVPSFTTRHGALGFYVRETQRVFFGLGYEAVAYVVRHEDLHHLLVNVIPPPTGPETFEQSQRRTHPAEFYGGKDSTGTVIHGKCQDLVYPAPASPEAPHQTSSSPSHS